MTQIAIGASIVVIELAVAVWLWLFVGSYLELLGEWQRGRSGARPKFWRWIFGLPNPWHEPKCWHQIH